MERTTPVAVSMFGATGPVSVALVLTAVSLMAHAQDKSRVLTGWGGGKPEVICPKAAAVGFGEIIVWNRDPEYLRRLVDVAAQYDIDVYASVHLNDVKTWKKRFPDVPPPLQVMSAEEDAALKQLRDDNTPGKGHYQYGGEPVRDTEVLLGDMLCFHAPEVSSFFKKEIEAALAVDGLKGIAFDFFGYRNYRCCRCPVSMRRFDAFCKQHPDLPRAEALDRFSLETLVAFNNELAAHARSVKPGVKVATHVYPVFLPEPLYGNRLDVDRCGQTAAWYFEPFWSLEKIKHYAHVISAEARKHYPHAEGAALIGIHRKPDKYGGMKTPDRIAAELRAILEGGCTKVQVCSMNAVLDDEEVAAVFKSFFGKQQATDSVPKGTVDADP